MAAWLAPRTRATTRSLHGREQLARGLDRRWQLVGDGRRRRDGVAGAGGGDRPRPGSPGRPQRRANGSTASCSRMAEQHLVEKAADFTPPALRALGERILEVICPEQYDDHERTALLAAERRASAATRLTLHVRGDGSVDVRARIPEASAARLQTYLEAFTAPRRSRTRRPRRHEVPSRGGRLPVRWTPTTWTRPTGGGCRPTSAAARRSAPCSRPSTPTGCRCTAAPRPPWWSPSPTTASPPATGVGTLGDGTRTSAGEVRRLACTAGILPAVLGGNSEVLDLGRTRRLFSAAQRKALADPASAPAGPTAARCPPPGAKPTTPATPGAAAAAPTSPTACCSAPGTTTASTTTATSSRTRPTDGVRFHRRT